MACYGYVRVSTGRQAEEGESLGVQERVIQGHALIQGFTVDRVFVERGVSGSKPLTDRPAGAELVAVLKPGDVLIASKLDRMFRSALDALGALDRFKAMGVSLHFVDLGGDVVNNGLSKLVFTILSAVAEAERDRIRERICDVKADQQKRGRFLGGARPFGYVVGDDGELVEDAAEQAAIAHMVELRGAGQSLRTIATTMKEAGHSLSHVAVSRVLDRAAECSAQ
jgi:DNA invertase Pin-like site-specific DNA recombinase